MANSKPTLAQQMIDIRKGGGLAFRPDYIRELLNDKGNGELYTRDELINKISGYFTSCLQETEDPETGEKLTIWRKAPTKGELALVLGITPQTLIDYCNGYYQNGKTYSDTNPDDRRKVATADFDILRKAYTLIESYYEGLLSGNRNNAGVIFWLLNRRNSEWTNEHTTIIKNETSPHKYDNSQLLARLGSRIEYIEGEEGENDNDD